MVSIDPTRRGSGPLLCSKRSGGEQSSRTRLNPVARICAAASTRSLTLTREVQECPQLSWCSRHVAPRGFLRQPFRKAEDRPAFGGWDRGQRDQRARYRAVTVGAKPHCRVGRFARRRSGAAEQVLPALPIAFVRV